MMVEKLTFLWVFLLLLYPVKPQDDARPLLDEFGGGFSAAGNSMSLDGVAGVDNNGVLWVTDFSAMALGHGFYSHPIKFKNSSGEVMSFSTSFAFAIITQHGIKGGDGMAFAISPVKGIPGGDSGSYLGLFNATNNGNSANHIFAVEFDTYKNVQLVEYVEPDGNHVAIDINSISSTKSTLVMQFKGNDTNGTPLNLMSGQVIQAWIDYNSPTNQLDIRISTDSAKPSSVLLSSKVNLSEIFYESMYIGFSAATGLAASSHCILGWSFNVNGDAKSLDLSQLPKLQLPTTATGTKKNRGGLIAGVSVSMAVILLNALSFYIVRRKKMTDVVEDWEHDIGPHRFPYEELKKATKGFIEKELIGSGGFGRVYKGILPNSDTQVAVKRVSQHSKQGLRAFISEISTIGRLRHRNLVQLLGWCRRKADLLLVYEFMPNGSLDNHLFDEPKSVLSWEQRFKIIKGLASGLLYLHEEWEKVVVHRDIKSGNVLLDSEFNARLSDFGLAKLYERGSNPSTSRVVGTLGYMAPELTRTGKPTTRSDVFSFGVLLLEVICGRRPINHTASSEELMLLVDCVWEKWAVGAVLDVVDPRMEGKFDEDEAVLVLKLGLICSNDEAEARPTMRLVVRYLEGELALPEEVAMPNKREGGGRGTVEFEDCTQSIRSIPTTSSVYDVYGR
jgi:hypothetical protein